MTLRGTGEKTGEIGSKDELPPLDVAAPPQFGGPDGVWSPEHLFVAAVASCLMTTFRAIAASSGLEVVAYSDSGEGTLDREGNLFHVAGITLRPEVVVSDPTTVDKALRLLEKAENACLISRSVKTAIRIEPKVTVAAVAS